MFLRAMHRLAPRLAGAADIAVLMPLLLALERSGCVEGRVALVGTGVAYVTSSMMFRIPMPVQPLKSLAVLALSAGASASEMRLAGLILGAGFLALAFGGVEKFLARCPFAIVHALQLGLAVLLLGQASRMAMADGGSTIATTSVLVPAVLGAIVLEKRAGFPVIAALTVATVMTGLVSRDATSAPMSHHLSDGSAPRWGLIATMVLTQIPLTLGNSVLGTHAAARAYFGDAAHRVTPRRLLLSMGAGNVVAALVGGLPFCHGSGGLTAHVRAGAREPLATALFGVVLIVAGLALGPQVFAALPRFGLAMLLALTAVHHAALARPSLEDPALRLPMVAGAAMSAFTGNLLAGVLAFAAFAWLAARFKGGSGVAVRWDGRAP